MRSKLREGGSGKPATTCNRRFELGVNPTRGRAYEPRARTIHKGRVSKEGGWGN